MGMQQSLHSENSIYLVVFNATVDIENNGSENWINLIHESAPDSEIILVGTHSDIAKDNALETVVNGISVIQERNSQISGHFLIDNSTKSGLKVYTFHFF